MYFPLELPLGKHIPLYGSIPGRSFRLRHHPETTSQSERGFRDGLSAWAAIGKACPGLRCQGVFFTAAPCIEFDSPRYGLEIKRQVDTNIYLSVAYGGAYEKNGELHQYRHPRGYPTRYLHCKGIEKLVCCRWNVPEIAISGVCKIPDGRLAVSPSNARKRGTPCQGAPLER